MEVLSPECWPWTASCKATAKETKMQGNKSKSSQNLAKTWGINAKAEESIHKNLSTLKDMQVCLLRHDFSHLLVCEDGVSLGVGDLAARNLLAA